MACTHLGIIILSIAALAAVEAQPEVFITTEVTEVSPGEEFNIKCTVRNLKGGASFLRIEKYFHDQPNPVVFGTNSILQEEFKSNARFAINFNAAPDGDINFLLTIKDARAEDSGMYACAIYGGDGIIVEDKKPITVINTEGFHLTVTVNRLSTGDEYVYETDVDETHEFSLDNSEKFKITMTTTATHPAPSVVVKVGSRDITKHFTVETAPETFAGEGSLEGVKFSLTATATLFVDHSFTSGLSFVVSVGEHAQLEEKFKFAFTGFPPQLDSCANKLMAADHELDVVYNCTFLSSDPPEVFFYYNRELASGGVEQIKLFPGEFNSQYDVELYEEDSQTYIAFLKIEIVFPQMFRSHYLVVKNSKGNITHEFEIENDMSREFDTSASSHMIVSIAAALLVAIATIFHTL